MVLYKFLPEVFADSLLDGTILFRNLIYFKRLEHGPRVDLFEGIHSDAPDHDVKLTDVKTGRSISGRYAFHNTSKKPEHIFVFCTSMACGDALTKFGETCVRINDVQEFTRRIQRALASKKTLLRLEKPVLLANPITYYRPNTAAPPHIDVKNPRHLPFVKRHDYADEQEFRFVFARRGGYELKERIVTRHYSELNDIAGRKEAEHRLRIGQIRDIAERVSLGSAGAVRPDSAA
ncbi:MAG: hypothetical protein HC871_05495 [Rhizobiales bacterium]|nr:hypothetical protein [Hyphomicrobiales bacterium]